MACHQTNLEYQIRYLMAFVMWLIQIIPLILLFVYYLPLFLFIFLGFIVFLTIPLFLYSYYQLPLLPVADIMALPSWYGCINTSISLQKQFSKYLSPYAFLLSHLLAVTLNKLNQYKADACSLNSTVPHPFKLDNSSHPMLNYWPRRVLYPTIRKVHNIPWDSCLLFWLNSRLGSCSNCFSPLICNTSPSLLVSTSSNGSFLIFWVKLLLHLEAGKQDIAWLFHHSHPRFLVLHPPSTTHLPPIISLWPPVLICAEAKPSALSWTGPLFKG